MSTTGCYSSEGATLKCFKCGSTNIKHVTRDVIPVLDNGTGPECEFSEECADCGTILAYWAYGSYDPTFVFAGEARGFWSAFLDGLGPLWRWLARRLGREDIPEKQRSDF